MIDFESEDLLNDAITAMGVAISTGRLIHARNILEAVVRIKRSIDHLHFLLTINNANCQPLLSDTQKGRANA